MTAKTPLIQRLLDKHLVTRIAEFSEAAEALSLAEKTLRSFPVRHTEKESYEAWARRISEWYRLDRTTAFIAILKTR